MAVKQIAKNGIDGALNKHGIEAIIAPTESPISSLASSAGKLCHEGSATSLYF